MEEDRFVVVGITERRVYGDCTEFQVSLRGRDEPLICWHHAGVPIPYWERSQELAVFDEQSAMLLRLLAVVRASGPIPLPLDLRDWFEEWEAAKEDRDRG